MSFPLYVLTVSLLAIATAGGVLLARQQRLLAAAIALLGATAILLIHGPFYFDFYADDALITLRYSQHLADGQGPNWNSDGRVEGYTTFLWMGTHAGLAKIGFDVVEMSRVLGLAAVVGTMLIMHRTWSMWSDDEPAGDFASPLVIAAAIIALALTDGVAFWGFSGMETAAFMALLTLSAFLFLREQRAGGLPWSAVALAATAMTRPEGLIAIAVSGAFLVIRAGFASDRREALLRLASWSAVLLVLYGSYFAWRYTYYDHLLPNTFYAKVEPTSALYERGLDYVWTYAFRYQLLPLLGGVAVLLTNVRLRSDAAYVLVLTAAMLAGVVIEGGDDFPHGRMIIPILPLVYVAGLAGLATLLGRLSTSAIRSGVIAAAVLTLGAVSLFHASLELAGPVEHERQAQRGREVLGRWLSDNTPPDYTIAAFAVGAIGYYGERDVLDLLGLNDVVIAHSDVPDFGTGLAGHEKYNIDYVLDNVLPEIIITNDAQPGPLTTEAFRVLAAVPSPVVARNALFADLRLWQLYDVRSVKIDGLWFNFLQRKDTLSALVER
ncbi:MAG: hypothetical protein IH865_01630 [Chloroflexi bacterium]|nr:hypothetical protein [Chloroflexota bacterium]